MARKTKPTRPPEQQPLDCARTQARIITFDFTREGYIREIAEMLRQCPTDFVEGLEWEISHRMSEIAAKYEQRST